MVLAEIILTKHYYLVPMHGWFELMDDLKGHPLEKYEKDIPSIERIVGWYSNHGNYYRVNPFGEDTLQITESGKRLGDILVRKDKVKEIKEYLLIPKECLID